MNKQSHAATSLKNRLLAIALIALWPVSYIQGQDPLPVRPQIDTKPIVCPKTNDSIVVFGASQAETPVGQPWDERLKAELDKLASEAEKSNYNAGICVWDLTSDSLLWGYNNHKIMRPASTQKILTAISALSILGSQHEFKTIAYYTGSISPEGVLDGDIYVVGDFDPMFSIADLRELARKTSSLGIKAINGKVYGDASMKCDELYGNGWCWDDVPSKNQPHLCALMLERGMLAPRFSKYSDNASFHPAEHFVQVLCDELKSLNISVQTSGYGIREYKYNGTLFYTKTRTIDQVMQQMLKDSDNLHAEALFFQLANAAAGKHCTWKDGAKQIENVLRNAGTSTSSVDVADGSGVSLYNYVTPDAQVAMLRFAFRNNNIYQHFYPALPIAGVDGTLSSRMKSGNAYRNVHAKTGTVKGVIGLCGYVTASNGHQLAFSILTNGVLSSQVARNFQDRICQELAR